MEDRQTMTTITAIFFVPIAAIPWLIIVATARKRATAAGIWAAALPLATTGLIVALASYALYIHCIRDHHYIRSLQNRGVFGSFADIIRDHHYIRSLQNGQPPTGSPCTGSGVTHQLIESAVKASTTTAYAVFAIPCLSGITAGTVAILTSATMALIKYIQDQPWP